MCLYGLKIVINRVFYLYVQENIDEYCTRSNEALGTEIFAF